MPVRTKNLFLLAAGASAAAAMRLPKLGAKKLADGLPDAPDLPLPHLPNLRNVLSRKRSGSTADAAEAAEAAVPIAPGPGRHLVPTPEYAESAAVTNACGGNVAVAVVYDDWGDQLEITEEHVLQPGATIVYGTKVLRLGTIVAVAPIKRIELSHADGQRQTLEPSVYGIVDRLRVVVLDDGRLIQAEPAPKRPSADAAESAHNRPTADAAGQARAEPATKRLSVGAAAAQGRLAQAESAPQRPAAGAAAAQGPGLGSGVAPKRQLADTRAAKGAVESARLRAPAAADRAGGSGSGAGAERDVQGGPVRAPGEGLAGQREFTTGRASGGLAAQAGSPVAGVYVGALPQGVGAPPQDGPLGAYAGQAREAGLSGAGGVADRLQGGPSGSRERLVQVPPLGGQSGSRERLMQVPSQGAPLGSRERLVQVPPQPAAQAPVERAIMA